MGGLSAFFQPSPDEPLDIVVGKRFRRTGIGRQLLAKGKRRYARCKVNPNNHPVIALLESEGFVRDELKLTGSGWIAYNYRRA
jgi:hypothetical protein